MSQRIPSHCSAIDATASTAASRSRGRQAFSCSTSGHGGNRGRARGRRPCARPRGMRPFGRESSGPRDEYSVVRPRDVRRHVFARNPASGRTPRSGVPGARAASPCEPSPGARRTALTPHGSTATHAQLAGARSTGPGDSRHEASMPSAICLPADCAPRTPMSQTASMRGRPARPTLRRHGREG